MLQVKLNVSLLDGISDDLEFCLKLAHEESVTVFPGKKKVFTTILHCIFVYPPTSNSKAYIMYFIC